MCLKRRAADDFLTVAAQDAAEARMGNINLHHPAQDLVTVEDVVYFLAVLQRVHRGGRDRWVQCAGCKWPTSTFGMPLKSLLPLKMECTASPC